MKQRLTPAALAALTCLALASCGSDTSDDAAAAPVPPSNSVEAPAGAVEDEARTAPATVGGDAEVKTLAADEAIPPFDGLGGNLFTEVYKVSTSDQQREVLADGNLTEDELSSLYDSVGACLEKHGATDFEYTLEGQTDYSYPDTISASDMATAERNCTVANIGATPLVAVAMDVDTADPGTTAGSEVVMDAMTECLVRFDVPARFVSTGDDALDSMSTLAEFGDDKTAMPQCMSKAMVAGAAAAAAAE